jgi:hypothetical protein
MRCWDNKNQPASTLTTSTSTSTSTSTAQTPAPAPAPAPQQATPLSQKYYRSTKLISSLKQNNEIQKIKI